MKSAQKTTLSIGHVNFPIVESVISYAPELTDPESQRSGSPWWFQIRADSADITLLEEDENDPDPKKKLERYLYGLTPRLYLEGDYIPLENKEDMTGVELYLEEIGDPDTGEPYFTLYLHEHDDLTNLRIKFIGKEGNFYQIIVSAEIPIIAELDNTLLIETWIEKLPDNTFT